MGCMDVYKIHKAHSPFERLTFAMENRSVSSFMEKSTSACGKDPSSGRQYSMTPRRSAEMT